MTNITDFNTRNDYDNIIDYIIVTNNLTDIFTTSENNIDVNIRSLLLTIACGISFFCLVSLMVHTLIKTLITNK